MQCVSPIFSNNAQSDAMCQMLCTVMYACTCTVSNYSSVFTYYYISAPAYVTSPNRDVEIDSGSSTSLECSAKAIPNDITYVWLKNGVVISGQARPSLSMTGIHVDDSGVYQCVPYNVYSNYNSSTMTVTVKG